MKTFEELKPAFEGKRILYITTKNLDYIRVTQEISLLKEIADDVKVIGSKSSSYPKRLLSVFGRLLVTSLTDIDVVFVGFAPQLVVPFFGKKLSKKSVVIDFFISVYDTMVLDRKKFKDGSFMASFSHKLDKKTLDRANYVVCDTRAHGDFFVREFSQNSDKMHVLYLQANKEIYYPRQASNPSTDGMHRVLYFGSILNLQGVEVILDALREFDGACDFEFEIIGPIKEEMNKPVQDNIHYYDWLSQTELAEHIANADLCLAGHFSKDIMKAQRTIPGKAYIYEAMEKPMILGDGPANHELFNKDSKHIFVPMGNPLALAQAIIVFFERNDSTIIKPVHP